MVILINNKKAALKKGSSFEFITENRFFTGADAYTLSITFPLKGCKENIDIFGHLYRKDVDLDTLLLDCEIHDKAFHIYGSVSIVEISETEVKTQFLEGRSARNFHSTFDDIYINEINLGNIHDFAHWSADYYMRSYDKWRQESDEDGIGDYEGYVCLPWVNNTSGNMQNGMQASTTTQGQYIYTGGGRDEDPSIVGMPYLFVVVKKILKKLGYTYDLSAIENTQWRHVIICNVLPMVWQIRDIQSVLPHWTVSEFLEQVELFLDGEFHIDEKAGHVSFTFNSQVMDNVSTVVLNDVIDEHQVEIEDEEKAKNSYYEQRNVAYADCDHQLWKYYSCDWALPNLPKRSWADFATMRSALSSYFICKGPITHEYYKQLHVCRAEDTYYILKCYRTLKFSSLIWHYMRLQPVDMFGRKYRWRSDEDEEVTELRIVPVCIDHTENGKGDVVFMECGELGDDVEDAEDKDENQTQAVNTINAGEKDKKEEFYDKLYVGFWDGNYQRFWPLLPHPIIDPYMVDEDNYMEQGYYTMRLYGTKVPATRTKKFKVEQTQKFTFKFLAKDGQIPDVRSVFLIHGKRYLAEKITATFTETGMSQQLKLTAYRLI